MLSVSSAHLCIMLCFDYVSVLVTSVSLFVIYNNISILGRLIAEISCRGCSTSRWIYSPRQDISAINRPSMHHIIYHMVNGLISL